MQLEYYYLVFEEDMENCVDCPYQLWESILRKLCVVFSVYGFSKSFSDVHELHVICEDHKELSFYDQLSDNIKSKLREKTKDNIIDLKGFTRFMKHVLLREDGLYVIDNTEALFGAEGVADA